MTVAIFKTVVCFAYLALAAVGLVPIAVVAILLRPLGLKRQMSVLIYRVAQGWSLSMISFIGCPMTVTGRENIPIEGGVCFVGNHSGIADILMLLAYAGRPVGFIAKKELLAVPLINMWISVIGGFFIDRKNPRKALATINSGVQRLRSGGAMIVFPEGSRSRGRGLGPFRPGAFRLATGSGAAIVPVAISGTYGLFEKNRRVVPCPVSVAFLEPIQTEGIPDDERKIVLAERVRSAIAAALSGNADGGENENSA